MKGLFDINSPAMRFLSRIADLIAINLMTILFSIPVVTMGAAITAMYRTTFNIAKDEGTILSAYWKSFKMNFKQSTILWLIMLVVGVFLFFDFRFVYLLNPEIISFKAPLYIIFGILTLIYAFIYTYLFPLVSQYNNTNKAMLMNSLIFSISSPFLSLFMSILNAVAPFLLLYDMFNATGYLYSSGIFWIIIGFSLIAQINTYIISFVIKRVQQKQQFLLEADEEEEEEDEEEEEEPVPEKPRRFRKKNK